MDQEVCYERLRPAQIRAAREACPVAYIPIGTIEWHGVHNPVGLDTLKAHALCVECARAGGGLVFPALYYGEARENCLMETNSGDREKIAEGMGLPPENFAPGYMMRAQTEEADHYQWLLQHILYQVRSLGFKVGVICAGHYPLIDLARAACLVFHQQQIHYRAQKMIPWVFTGYELVGDLYDFAGDHAGYWETSLLMSLLPGLSDLSQLPDDPNKKVVGAGGKRPPREANAEAGKEYVQAIVKRVVEQVNDRLNNPHKYRGHNLPI